MGFRRWLLERRLNRNMRRLHTRIIAVLVERLGGEVQVSYEELRRAADLHMKRGWSDDWMRFWTCR
jgi:hypothetical protein